METTVKGGWDELEGDIETRRRQKSRGLLNRSSRFHNS